MSYTPTNVEIAVYDGVRAMLDGIGRNEAILIYSYPDAPRPGAGATYMVMDVLADQRLGTATTRLTDTPDGEDFERETRLHHRLEIALTTYGPDAYQLLADVILSAEIPEVQDAIYALSLALPRFGVARRVPAELGVAYEDRWTVTLQGGYEERVVTPAAAVEILTGTVAIEDAAPTDPLVIVVADVTP